MEENAQLNITLHRQRDFFDCFSLTTSTEHGAWPTTDKATLPRNKRLMPVYPCEPRIIRSADHSRASSTISEEGSPVRITGSTFSSFAFRRSTVFFVRLVARRFISRSKVSRLSRPPYHG